jgi:hypothetical protein
MSDLTRAKIIGYLAALFLVGAVSGALVTWSATKPKRADSARRQTMGDVCDHVKKRYQTRLGLNEEQMRKVEPMIDQTFKEVRGVHERSMKEIDEIFDRSNAEITKELDPSQQARLAEMSRERQEFHKKKLKGGQSAPP